jgi:hypothetical protein
MGQTFDSSMRRGPGFSTLQLSPAFLDDFLAPVNNFVTSFRSGTGGQKVKNNNNESTRYKRSTSKLFCQLVDKEILQNFDKIPFG